MQYGTVHLEITLTGRGRVTAARKGERERLEGMGERQKSANPSACRQREKVQVSNYMHAPVQIPSFIIVRRFRSNMQKASK